MVWALYATSALLGVGAAVLWTAQGSALTLNSTKETMGRNSGIFWAMLQSSLLVGNLLEYFTLNGHTSFDTSTRILLFSIFSGCAVFGTLVMLFLRYIPEQDTARADGDLLEPKGSNLSNSVDAISKAYCK